MHNVLGPRLCLVLGTWGYSLYIASFLYVPRRSYPLRYLPTILNSATNIHPGAGDFVVVAGAILGVCASLVWTAQGSLMMAYPTEAQKGTFIGYFWAIFNLGGVVGSAVAFGLNFNSTVSFSRYISCAIFMNRNQANKVGNGTYVGQYIFVMFLWSL